MKRMPRRTHLSSPGQTPPPMQPRSVTALLVLLAIVVLGVVLLSRSARVTGPSVDGARAAATARPDRAALERAVLGVEDFVFSGAMRGAAEEVAEEVVARGNARGGAIRYQIGRPAKAWSIVLVPLPELNAIRVEGYAENLELPMYMTEVSVADTSAPPR